MSRVNAGSARVGPAPFRAREWLPPVLLSCAFLVALVFNDDATFDPAWLLVPLNTVFLTVVPLIVAWISVSAYLSTGVRAALAMGAGMLAVGVGGGLVPGALRYVIDANANVTMHNSAVLLAAALQVLAAVLSVVAIVPREERTRRRDLAITYSFVIAVLVVVLVLVLSGVTPQFFDPDAGPTTVRQSVLGTAVGLFAIASVIWALTYYQTQLTFARWYVMGLVLFTLGLTAILVQESVGNVLCWVGRSAQYVGALYFLAAVWQLHSARTGPDSRVIGMSLLRPAVRFQPMVDSAEEAVIVVDGDVVMYWNDTARTVLGYREIDAFGQHLLDLIAPAEFVPDSRDALARLLSGANVGPGNRWEGELRTRSGATLPAEVVAYRYADGGLRVCMIRDITERVRAQEELRAAHAELELRAEQLEEAQRVAKVGSWYWDAAADEVSFSPEMWRIAGLVPGANPLTFAEAAEFVNRVDLATSRLVLHQALRDHRPFELDQRLELPDGEVRYLLAHGEVVLGASGAAVGIRGTTQDVTALRRAERDAAAARERAAAEDGRARKRAERERYAREVNDAIVQGLVAAEMALDRHDVQYARRLIGDTSYRARHWIGELLEDEGPLQPGAARRSTAVPHETAPHHPVPHQSVSRL